uniref:Uncharacterized protein n=1 Tax=Picea glauca TaxID=3330 RepID=A0A101M0M5_PICGL|nr:hypothetical protein ABT39_MTgene4735 [Picea glauca]
MRIELPGVPGRMMIASSFWKVATFESHSGGIGYFTSDKHRYPLDMPKVKEQRD